MLSYLAAGGLIFYWENLWSNPRGLKMKIDEIGPQVLTMEHLMFGFYIWLAVLAISIIAFVGEKATKAFIKLTPKIKKNNELSNLLALTQRT